MTAKEEKTIIEATVVFPRRSDGALLFAKKTMKIGEGCWNGYGGGKEGAETIEETAVRELEEESGLVARVEDLEKIAVLRVYNHKSDGRVVFTLVHFYVAKNCLGEVRETPEMITPTWFQSGEIPLDQLMPADKLWLPEAFDGKKLVVTVHYGPFQKELLKPVDIEEVENFEQFKDRSPIPTERMR